MSEPADNNTGGDGGTIFTDGAVAGHLTRQMMIDATKLVSQYPCPVRRVFEVGGYELLPTEIPEMGHISLPLPERKPGDVVVLPNRFDVKFEINLDAVKDRIVAALTPYVGQVITEAMVAEVTRRTGEALNAALTAGFDASCCITPKLPPLETIAFDWEKEQKAIAEEARYQARLQAQVQEEIKQANYHAKAMAEEAAVDAELARMADDGCPQPHPEACADRMIPHLKAHRLEQEFMRHHVPPRPIANEQVFEFFAYETIGATIPHAGEVVRTDDPELMKALGDTIVSIDGVPVGMPAACRNPKTVFDDDVKPDAVVG